MELFERSALLGHWRAPYMLALAYDAGAGVLPNCTRAAAHLRTFFTERGTWGDQLTAAVKALDAGEQAGRAGAAGRAHDVRVCCIRGYGRKPPSALRRTVGRLPPAPRP